MSEIWGPFPLQIGDPKTTFLGRLRNLTATLMACIFGTKNDIDNRSSALTTTRGLSAAMRPSSQITLGRLVIIRPRRCRSAAAYTRQTFPWTISRSIGPYVRPYIGLSSALWQNGGPDPDAVFHRRSDEPRDEAGSGVWGSVHGKGYF